MTYNYNGQNQVTKVVDASLANKGFIYKNASVSTAFTYDSNGNLTSDANKGITSIEYNYLNLPIKIVFNRTFMTSYSNGSIEFIYDATGVKLRKTVKDVNGNVLDTRDYVNGVEYNNGTLSRIAHTEGSVERNEFGAYEHQYVLRDHLGNTRVTFRDGVNKGEAYFDWTTYQYIDPNANNPGYNDGTITSADIMQINSYYPFGLNMEGNWNGAAGNNKIQYNGKEWNDDFGLGLNDYGARFYDPATGRFPSVDPLAFKYSINSPYSYCSNSPTNFVDVNGLYFSKPEDREKLDKVQTEISDKISQLEKFGTLLKGMNGTEKLNNNINSSVAELKSSNTEIDLMRLDRNVSFTLSISDKPQTSAASANSVNIAYDGTTGSLLHEAAHGYQYLTGEVDFIKTADGIIPGLLYDQTDEVTAYRRQFAFNQTLVTKEAIFNNMDLAKKLSLLKNNTITISSVHDITTSLINRIGDGAASPLYDLIPKVYLNSGTSGASVREANVNRQDMSYSIGLERNSVPYKQSVSKSSSSKFIFVK